VTLEAPAAGRLDRAGIVLTAAGSPAAAHGALAFPVSGGLIWSESGWGTVDHAGSLTVTDTDTNRSVSLSNIELDFLPTPAVFVRTSQGTTFQLFDVLLKEQPATGITLTSERGTHRRVDYTGVGSPSRRKVPSSSTTPSDPRLFRRRADRHRQGGGTRDARHLSQHAASRGRRLS